MKRRYLVLAATGIVLSGVLVAGSRWLPQKPETSDTFVAKLKTCLTDKEAIVKCAPEIIRSYMRSQRAAETMHVLSAAFSTRDCHVMGHTVGQITYAKSGSIEKALNACDQTCGAACLHGAVGEAFVTETGLNPDNVDLKHLTADQVRTYGTALCKSVDTCHGVGHILVQIYNEIETPLSVCSDIADGVKLQSCFTGVFMENADTISSHNLLLGTRKEQVRDPGDLAYPCDEVQKDARHACLRYQPRLQEALLDEKGILDKKERTKARIHACETFKSRKDRTDCYEGLGFASYVLIQEDPAMGRRYCAQFPSTEDRAACLLGMTFWAANFGQIDESLSFCESVQNTYERDICYHGVFETLISNGGSADAVGRYCERHDAERCMAGYKEYVRDPWQQLFGVPTGS